MQLVIKQGEKFVKESHFARGPLYIGRQIESHICLPDIVVSRQHAVIFGADENQWFVEDLGSANKTYLNGKAIHKSQLQDGDIISVAGFTIELHITSTDAAQQPAAMTETMVLAVHAPETIIRRYHTSDAPDIKMPARRAADYAKATTEIYSVGSIEELQQILMNLTSGHFNTFHHWVGLRKETTGPFAVESGFKSTGQTVSLSQLIFRETINDAIEKQQHVLIPLLPKNKEYERTRSAMIAPVISAAGCYGAIYADNATDQKHYSLTDLDYLMLLSIQAGTVIEKL